VPTKLLARRTFLRVRCPQGKCGRKRASTLQCGRGLASSPSAFCASSRSPVGNAQPCDYSPAKKPTWSASSNANLTPASQTKPTPEIQVNPRREPPNVSSPHQEFMRWKAGTRQCGDSRPRLSAERSSASQPAPSCPSCPDELELAALLDLQVGVDQDG